MADQKNTVDRDRQLIISFDGVRRELAIPFQICGSEKALRHLQRALSAALEKQDGTRFHYGWVDITQLPEFGPANKEPLSWRDDGSYYGD